MNDAMVARVAQAVRDTHPLPWDRLRWRGKALIWWKWLRYGPSFVDVCVNTFAENLARAAIGAMNASIEAERERCEREAQAVAIIATDMISTGLARILNRTGLMGEAGSPERYEFTEAQKLIWDAMNLLDPGRCHEDDRPQVLERIAAIRREVAPARPVLDQLAPRELVWWGILHCFDNTEFPDDLTLVIDRTGTSPGIVVPVIPGSDEIRPDTSSPLWPAAEAALLARRRQASEASS